METSDDQAFSTCFSCATILTVHFAEICMMKLAERVLPTFNRRKRSTWMLLCFGKDVMEEEALLDRLLVILLYL